MRKLPNFVIAALLSSLSLFPACGPKSNSANAERCTQIGCADGLRIDLSPNAHQPSGSYRFDIEADGAKQSCEGVLPLQACGSSASVHCTGTEIAAIGESGCALPPIEHALTDVFFSGTPKKVHISVYRNGTKIADKDIAPLYQTKQPNGPNCPPTCTTGKESLELKF